jgi:hypothetical protein
MDKLCKTYFSEKKESSENYLGQDPDPEVLNSRIQTKTARIQNNFWNPIGFRLYRRVSVTFMANMAVNKFSKVFRISTFN